MTTNSGTRALSALGRFLKDLFNLETGKADEQDTIDDIKKNVEFKGANLWILIFAIFIASIGLNVNSTAVIIGAMLISPLMGPILGVGLGVGINDLDLIKKSFRNLGVAALISVITSTLYFSISPLSDAQSELLARTTPTIWDVLIASFGGLAGIVAGSRKEKSNAIPGVAIATALMPPLCTAGYGLANWNLYYFMGALYLFFINSVFIALATFVIVRALKFPRKEFVDAVRERHVKTAITLIVLVTIVPSIYLGYTVVRRSIFTQNALKFINQELQFDNCRVISRNITYEGDTRRIEVSLFGEPIDSALINNARAKLVNFSLEDANLVVFQGYHIQQTDAATLQSSIRSGIIEDLYQKNEEILKSKEEQIRMLEDEVVKLKRPSVMATEVAPELKALNRYILEFSLDRTLVTRMDSLKQDTLYLAYFKFSRYQSRRELKKLEDWIKARLRTQQVKMITK